MSQIIKYLLSSWMELMILISMLSSIYFAINQNRISWIFLFIASIFNIIVLFKVKLYLSVCLFAYFAITAIYGWFNWGKNNDKNQLKISQETNRSRVIICVSVVIISTILGFFMERYTDINFAYGDAFVVVLSVVAIWQAAQKKMENWISRGTANFISLFVSIFSGLYIVALLCLLTVIMAIQGWVKWGKEKPNKHFH